MEIERKSFRREELEALSSQQPDDLLHAEMNKDSKDDKAILQILSILESRESGDPANDTDVSDAWAQYKKSCANAEEEVELLNAAARKGRKPSRWRTSIAAAAIAAVALVLFAPRVIGAENIFTVIGCWTQSIFSFFDPSQATEPQDEYIFQTEDPNLQRIYDAVAAEGVTKPVVPTWIPEGYIMEEFKVTTLPEGTKVYACLMNGDKCITIVIQIYSENRFETYEKDRPDAKKWDLAGVTHYIMTDEETCFAVWSAENLECMISADYPENVLHKILRSIYN